jgi:hypothetical protein
MKTFRIFSLSIASLFLAISSFSQAKTESIKVLGNCGMCETKIEKAAKDAGATSAEWDADTKMLKVSYTSTSTNAAKIQQAVAGVGYDTRDFRAKDETYNKLHGCCKYERAASTTKACCADCKMKDGKCEMDKGCCKKDGAEKSQACCSEKGEGAKADCCSADADKTAAHKADKSCCAAH